MYLNSMNIISSDRFVAIWFCITWKIIVRLKVSQKLNQVKFDRFCCAGSLTREFASQCKNAIAIYYEEQRT